MTTSTLLYPGTTGAKATELGGRVVVPPFDTPWSPDTYTIRMT
jgi:hypothetical protein